MDTPRSTTFRSVCKQIRRTFADEMTNLTIAEIYSKYDIDREREISSRRIRWHWPNYVAEKHLDFLAYHHQLDEEIPAECPRCGEGEHTLEHWCLGCPGTLETKQHIGGGADQGLSQLTRNPSRVLALVRRTLQGVGESRQLSQQHAWRVVNYVLPLDG